MSYPETSEYIANGAVRPHVAELVDGTGIQVPALHVTEALADLLTEIQTARSPHLAGTGERNYLGLPVLKLGVKPENLVLGALRAKVLHPVTVTAASTYSRVLGGEGGRGPRTLYGSGFRKATVWAEHDQSYAGVALNHYSTAIWLGVLVSDEAQERDDYQLRGRKLRKLIKAARPTARVMAESYPLLEYRVRHSPDDWFASEPA